MNRAKAVVVLAVVAVLSVGLIVLLWGFAAVRGAAPSVVIGTVQTDLHELEEQIRLPGPGLNARWVFARESDRGLLPSPGTAFLIARVEMPPNAIQQLLSDGEWTEDTEPHELLTRVRLSTDGNLRAFRGQSTGIAHSVIVDTTWMVAQVWVDAKRNALFILAKKS